MYTGLNKKTVYLVDIATSIQLLGNVTVHFIPMSSFHDRASSVFKVTTLHCTLHQLTLFA